MRAEGHYEIKQQVKERINIIELVRYYGVRLQKSGNVYKGLCPFHNDTEPSLIVYQNTQRWQCYGCGKHGDCFDFVREKKGVDFPDALEILIKREGIDLRKVKKSGGGGHLFSKKTCAHLHTPSESCSLKEYAEKKKLPIVFLKQIGLKDCSYLSNQAIRIPYLDETGQEISVRFRTALEKTEEGDNRFKWKKGSKLYPYGLWRLNDTRKKGYIILIEGESDCHTLWQSREPALGIPGASTWKEEWAEYLEGIPRIYTRIEPDAAGESLLEKLGESKIRDRLYLIDLDDTKDPSELYLKDPEHFFKNWQKAISEAVPWIEKEKLKIAAKRRKAWELCQDIAWSANILDCFIRLLRQKGVVGEENTAKLLYLAFTSRILEKPVSFAVKGPSSSGKSFVVEKVLKFFPKSAYYELTAMSERALAYSNESFRHRFIVIFEAAGLKSEFAQYLMRSLMSEGLIRYELVEKTSNGIRARIITKEGPTGFITTTTKIHLHPENETRFFSVQATDTAEQTKAIFKEIAEDKKDNIDLNSWYALQEWIEYGENRVKIYYAEVLAELIPPKAVRLRRDFGAMIRLIKTHALLHQANRERDAQNRIIATLDDYKVVRELIKGPISEGVEATVRETVRETVEVVRKLIIDKAEKGEAISVTIKELSTYLKLDRSAVTRRVDNALCMGYLQNLEDKKGRAVRLILSDPLPEEEEILPHPDIINKKWEVCRCAKNQKGIYNTPPIQSNDQDFDR